MAQKVIVELVDDLDGSEAQETVTFSVDGAHYEIDLSTDNADRLRGSLGEYVACARVAGAGERVKSKPKKKITAKVPVRVDKEQMRAKREWLRKQGHEVSDRGRIPSHLEELFDAAHAA